MDLKAELYANLIEDSTRLTIAKMYVKNIENIDRNTLKIILGQEPIKEANNND